MKNYRHSVGASFGSDLDVVYVDGVSYVRPATPSYNPAPFYGHAINRPAADADTAFFETSELSLTRRLLNAWAKSFSDLASLVTAGNVVTRRAAEWSVTFTTLIFMVNSNLPGPEIVISGDGAIDLEWTLNNRFISIHIGATDEDYETVYEDRDGTSQVTPFSPDTVSTVFAV